LKKKESQERMQQDKEERRQDKKQDERRGKRREKRREKMHKRGENRGEKSGENRRNGYLVRLLNVQRCWCLAGLDGAETAAARASIAHKHDCGCRGAFLATPALT
jgi:hypothetical protein